MFWLIAWWRARKVLGLVKEQGSRQKCSQPSPAGWSPVNKNLLLSTLTVGSYVSVTGGQAPVCSITLGQDHLP